jgi:hypothetical protein
MQLQQQTYHANETRYGEDADGEGCLFEDCETGVGEVVEECVCLFLWISRGVGGRGDSNGRAYTSYTDPGGEEETGVFGAAGEVENPGCYVGVCGIDG